MTWKCKVCQNSSCLEVVRVTENLEKFYKQVIIIGDTAFVSNSVPRSLLYEFCACPVCGKREFDDNLEDYSLNDFVRRYGLKIKDIKYLTK